MPEEPKEGNDFELLTAYVDEGDTELTIVRRKSTGKLLFTEALTLEEASSLGGELMNRCGGRAHL